MRVHSAPCTTAPCAHLLQALLQLAHARRALGREQAQRLAQLVDGEVRLAAARADLVQRIHDLGARTGRVGVVTCWSAAATTRAAKGWRQLSEHMRGRDEGAPCAHPQQAVKVGGQRLGRRRELERARLPLRAQLQRLQQARGLALHALGKRVGARKAEDVERVERLEALRAGRRAQREELAIVEGEHPAWACGGGEGRVLVLLCGPLRGGSTLCAVLAEDSATRAPGATNDPHRWTR